MENTATANEAMNLLKNASSTLETLVGKLKGGSRKLKKKRKSRRKKQTGGKRKRKTKRRRKSKKRRRTRHRKR